MSEHLREAGWRGIEDWSKRTGGTPAEKVSLPHKNLAVETLRKLLNNEIKIRSRKILIQSRSFSEMLEASIRKY